jgi:hypothetical protein
VYRPPQWGFSPFDEQPSELAARTPTLGGQKMEELSLVPIPELLTDGEGRVTGMNLSRVASDASGAIALSDPDALEILIGKMEFFVQHNAEGGGATYMFDEIRGDSGDSPRMFGDHTGFTLAPSMDLGPNDSISFGYRFGFYRIEVLFNPPL